MQETKKTRGGKRENAGRKKTIVKRYGFKAPQDIVDILENTTQPITQYICQAIRLKHETDQ